MAGVLGVITSKNSNVIARSLSAALGYKGGRTPHDYLRQLAWNKAWNKAHRKEMRIINQRYRDKVRKIVGGLSDHHQMLYSAMSLELKQRRRKELGNAAIEKKMLQLRKLQK